MGPERPRGPGRQRPKVEEGAGKAKRPDTASIAEDIAVPHRYSHFNHPEDNANSTRAAQPASACWNHASAEDSVGTLPLGNGKAPGQTEESTPRIAL